MRAYRFASKKYKDDISGTGAKFFGGRWNSKGYAALYTSQSISLALLEVLAHHIQFADINEEYLLSLELPHTEFLTIIPEQLKTTWKEEVAYTRIIGDSFLKKNNNLLLKIPSVIIPDEFNFLINPLHKDFRKVKIISSSQFQFDDRLFQYISE